MSELSNESALLILLFVNRTNKNQSEAKNVNQHLDIAIYAVLIVTLFITTVLRSITFFLICMRASKNLHNNIFGRLLRAPVAFFDTNPVGRILNRFTKDLGMIDEMLPNTAFDLNLVPKLTWFDPNQLIKLVFYL